MRKLMMVTMVALAVASLAGCNTCRRMTSGWFNHGDRCDYPPPPADCPPGVPRASAVIHPKPSLSPQPVSSPATR